MGSSALDNGLDTLKERHRETLQARALEALRDRFFADESVEELVRARAQLVDAVLRDAWPAQMRRRAIAPGHWWPSAATGAASCIPAPTSTSCCWCRQRRTLPDAARIERFVAFLWDIGLEVGHSVRTVEECVEESAGATSA